MIGHINFDEELSGVKMKIEENLPETLRTMLQFLTLQRLFRTLSLVLIFCFVVIFGAEPVKGGREREYYGLTRYRKYDCRIKNDLRDAIYKHLDTEQNVSCWCCGGCCVEEELKVAKEKLALHKRSCTVCKTEYERDSARNIRDKEAAEAKRKEDVAKREATEKQRKEHEKFIESMRRHDEAERQRKITEKFGLVNWTRLCEMERSVRQCLAVVPVNNNGTIEYPACNTLDAQQKCPSCKAMTVEINTLYSLGQ
jgi:hypothetical protein